MAGRELGVTATLLGMLLAAATCPTTATDKDTRRKETFACLRDELLRITKSNLEKESHLIPRPSAPVRMSALEPENAAATIERLALGLKTAVEGAEAGVVVSPFALKNPAHRLAGFSLTLAALKDEKVRAGAGFSSTAGRRLDVTDLDLPKCDDFADFERKLKYFEPVWDDACRLGIDLLPSPPPPKPSDTPADIARVRNRWTMAREACGNPPPAGQAGALLPTTTLIEVRHAMVETLKAADNDPAQHAAISGLTSERREELKAFKQVTYVSCHTDKEYRDAFAKAAWARTTVRFGALAKADFFPRHSGFNPDTSKPLSRGETGTWQIHGDLEVARARTTFVVGLGYGKTREDFNKPLYAWIGPSASISAVAFGLGSKPLLTKEGLPNLDDGNLPPHALLGLNLRTELSSGARPDGQTTAIRLLEVTPFLDFKISDKIAFRVAAPIAGKLAVREENKDKGIAAQRSLQWTTPFAFTTVVKP